MSVNLIGSDILLMRKRYDEALAMQGIPATYQFPLMATSNQNGESLIDSYSDECSTSVFFEGSPKVKTFKRLGWVVENDSDLPFLIHCSFDLPNLQKDSLFKFGSGHFSGLPDRVFRVTELTYDISCPDHVVCQVVPVYDKNVVGRTDAEVLSTFSTSNHFIKRPLDYRGSYHSTSEDTNKGGPK